MARGCSGTVIVRITRKGEPEPVYNAAVVADGEARQTLLTDADGRAEFSYPAPAVGMSLKPGGVSSPYSLCDMTISLPASGEIIIKGCQVFPYVVSYINLSAPENRGRLEIVIPKHSMLSEKQNRQGIQDAIVNADPEKIPEFIAVHCGKPEETAPDRTVRFSDFIANVASGMLYPTWPDSALRAEMLSIITLARCIIASGVHRGRGYDIAAEPDGSLYYFPERMIFEPFKRLSAELSPFCIKGGDRTKLFNSNRWESLALASKGRTELEIIKNRFGDSARVEECGKAVGAFSENGEPEGVTPEKIMELQKCLNNIAVWYPSIPMIIHADGMINNTMRIAMKAYRKQFGLPDSAVLDKSLVRSIEYVCSRLKKYAGGCACGRKKNKVLVEGDEGCEVVRLQHYLNGLSRRHGVRRIPPVIVNGLFDDSTRASLTAFQRFKRLPLSGVADHATWELLKKECRAFADRICEKKAYPGSPFTVGAEGENVAYIQDALNAFKKKVGAAMLPSHGKFDEKTLSALKEFQYLVGLNPNGIVDEDTWEALSEEFVSTGFTAVG